LRADELWSDSAARLDGRAGAAASAALYAVLEAHEGSAAACLGRSRLPQLSHRSNAGDGGDDGDALLHSLLRKNHSDRWRDARDLVLVAPRLRPAFQSRLGLSR